MDRFSCLSQIIQPVLLCFSDDIVMDCCKTNRVRGHRKTISLMGTRTTNRVRAHEKIDHSMDLKFNKVEKKILLRDMSSTSLNLREK